MAAGIVIVPGNNAVLQRLAQQLAPFTEVAVLPTANAMLWQARQAPPDIVVADVALADMTGAELVEILPNLAPSTRLILCGPRSPDLDRVVQGTTVQIVTPDTNPAQALWAIYKLLGIAPPPPRPATNPLDAQRAARTTPSVATEPTRGTSPSAPPAARAATPAAPIAPKQPTPSVAKDGTNTAFTTGRPVTPPNATTPTTTKAAPPTTKAASLSQSPSPIPRPPSPISAATAAQNGAAPAAFAPRGDALVIRPQQSAELQALLTTLATDVGAQAVLLSDMAGMVLLRVGSVANILPEILGPLLATNFSASIELSRQLRDQEPNALYLHEGARYDIYAFNVGYRFILTLIFDKEVGSSKLGSVWVYAKRVTRQLQQMLEA